MKLYVASDPATSEPGEGTEGPGERAIRQDGPPFIPPRGRRPVVGSCNSCDSYFDSRASRSRGRHLQAASSSLRGKSAAPGCWLRSRGGRESAQLFGTPDAPPLQRPSTMSTPDSTSSSLLGGSLPAHSSSAFRSNVTICETLATESRGRPVVFPDRRTFPGAPAHFKLLVSGTHTAVRRRLRFKASPCTITTGRRKPGPDPTGAGRSAHQTSPWEITNPCAPGRAPRRPLRTCRPRWRPRRRPYSSPPSPRPARDGPHTRAARHCRPRSATSPRVSPVSRLARKSCRESKPLSSYPKYNPALRVLGRPGLSVRCPRIVVRVQASRSYWCSCCARSRLLRFSVASIVGSSCRPSSESGAGPRVPFKARGRPVANRGASGRQVRSLSRPCNTGL